MHGSAHLTATIEIEVPRGGAGKVRALVGSTLAATGGDGSGDAWHNRYNSDSDGGDSSGSGVVAGGDADRLVRAFLAGRRRQRAFAARRAAKASGDCGSGPHDGDSNNDADGGDFVNGGDGISSDGSSDGSSDYSGGGSAGSGNTAGGGYAAGGGWKMDGACGTAGDVDVAA